MTGTTPLYGIRYPDSTTKLVGLGPELETFAGDVERVLQAAQIPAVTPANTVVAATQAARDQAWGVPSTDTQRRNLQNLGATTIRTDKGWTERYFAQYHATLNPGGVAAAGWYPLDAIDTGWVDVPASSGWSALAAQKPRVRRVGRQVTLSGIFAYGGTGSYGSMGVIPAAFLPDKLGPATPFVGVAIAGGGNIGAAWFGGITVDRDSGVLAFQMPYANGTGNPINVMVNGTWFTA